MPQNQQRLTIKQFQIKYGIAESTVRSWVKKKRLTTAFELINNRETKVVIIDEKALSAIKQYNLNAGNTAIDTAAYSENIQPISGDTARHTAANETIEDAEILDYSNRYQLVSMEQSSFDSLIQSIKELAEARAQTEKHAYDNLLHEYNKIQQQITQLQSKYEKANVEAIQAEAELRIKNIEMIEKDKKIEELERQNQDLHKTNEELRKKTKWWKINL